jgi:hypothetical protein
MVDNRTSGRLTSRHRAIDQAVDNLEFTDSVHAKRAYRGQPDDHLLQYQLGWIVIFHAKFGNAWSRVDT